MPHLNEPPAPAGDLTLPAAFPENQALGLPGSVRAGDLSALTLAPPSDLVISFTVAEDFAQRPRILIADDDGEVLRALRITAETWFATALDVRTWSPGGLGLVAHVLALREQGWPPALVVLDINLDEGGRSGVDYLAEFRRTPGLASLPVVLVTGNLLRDLDLNRVTDPRKPNTTKAEPKEWVVQAQKFEPEAVLYGKQGDFGFLNRLGENLAAWQSAARRRTWQVLLAKVSTMLDEGAPELQAVGQVIADFAAAELGIDEAFVRWRKDGAKFELIGCRSGLVSCELGSELNVETVPLLKAITEGQRGHVIRNGGVASNQLGTVRQQLSGMKFLGVGAVLEGKTVGTVAFLRNAAGLDFVEHLDGGAMDVLARLLASAVGQREAVTRLGDQRKKLLAFAASAESAGNFSEITQPLAELLHAELHAGDSERAEVSIRLLDFGEGSINRAGRVGMETVDPKLWLWTKGSAIARVVAKGLPLNIPDIQNLQADGVGMDTGKVKGKLRSELCVPLLVAGKAIGAANMEHVEPGYYDERDQSFATAAAAFATSAISRLRARKFTSAMASFATDFSRLSAQELEVNLRKMLVDFSGASAVVRLDALSEQNTTTPWPVKDIQVFVEGGTPELLQEQFTKTQSNDWQSTVFFDWIQRRVWNDGGCQFSERSMYPLKLRHSGVGESNEFNSERGVAALWMRPSVDAPPTGAIMLLWVFNPSLGEADIALLGNFAKLLSSLESREQQLKTWMETAVIGEQAAMLGYVTQHLRHRLGNDMGSLSGALGLLRLELKRGDAVAASALVDRMQQRINEVSGGISKSHTYIKAPQPSEFNLLDATQEALTPLQSRLQDVDVKVEIDLALRCTQDQDIFQLAIFTLVENALDAMASQDVRQLRIYAIDVNADDIAGGLAIEDSGPGVAEGWRDKLFKFGKTTKTNSLGSALAFSRARLRAAGGDLIWVRSSQLKGARFDITMTKAVA